MGRAPLPALSRLNKRQRDPGIRDGALGEVYNVEESSAQGYKLTCCTNVGDYLAACWTQALPVAASRLPLSGSHIPPAALVSHISSCFLPLVFSLSPLFPRKERIQFLINQISALSEGSEAGAQNTLDERPERAEGFTCWIWKLGFDVTLLRLSWEAACLLVASASLLDRGKLSGWSRREACPLHEG